MRKILLAGAILGIVVSTAGPARAWVVGPRFGRTVVIAPAPFYATPLYPVPVYPAPAYPPYVYGPSYVRPDIPYGWNWYRNWRDTWQDDGVKVHSYTLR
jgi:hypothetical protein